MFLLFVLHKSFSTIYVSFEIYLEINIMLACSSCFIIIFFQYDIIHPGKFQKKGNKLHSVLKELIIIPVDID